MKLQITALLSALVLVACADSEQERIATSAAETEYSFNNPQEVGILPDGRKVFLVNHTDPDNTYYPRHIYYVENGGTTTNVQVPSGKTSRQETTFIAPQETDAATKARQEVALREEVRRIANEKMAEARKLEEEAEALLSQ